MTRRTTILCTLLVASAAGAETPPVPPPRPAGLDLETRGAAARHPLSPSPARANRPPSPASPLPSLAATPAPAALGYAPAPEKQAPALFPGSPAARMDDAVCAAVLASGKVRATRAAPVLGAGGCGVAAPLRVLAFVRKDGGEAKLEPAALMRCDMAGALADWVRDDLAAVAAAHGAAIARIANAASYDCRGRNRQAGEKLSEHAFGNAMDVRAVVLSDGRSFDPKAMASAASFRDPMRASACARFATVLGPGSDGFHEDHIHLDLAQRRNGYKLCQWN